MEYKRVHVYSECNARIKGHFYCAYIPIMWCQITCAYSKKSSPLASTRQTNHEGNYRWHPFYKAYALPWLPWVVHFPYLTALFRSQAHKRGRRKLVPSLQKRKQHLVMFLSCSPLSLCLTVLAWSGQSEQSIWNPEDLNLNKKGNGPIDLCATMAV